MGAIIKLSIALSLDYLRERPAGGTRPRLLLGRGLKISRCASILTLGHHLPRALCVILIFWVKRVQPALKEFPPGLNDWPGCHSLRFGTRPLPRGGRSLRMLRHLKLAGAVWGSAVKRKNIFRSE